MAQREWTIQAMELDLPRLLALCHTPSERMLARVLHAREVRELAESLAAAGRLTPGGQAIAEKYGYRAGR